jgi:hypothetical protein
MSSLILFASFLVGAADPVPADNDVKAGWVAFWIFVGLAVAVVLLGLSLAKHLRKARDNAEQGVFDANDQRRHNAS